MNQSTDEVIHNAEELRRQLVEALAKSEVLIDQLRVASDKVRKEQRDD